MLNGEDGILALLGKYFPNSDARMFMGRGDDCALMDVTHGQRGIATNFMAVSSDIFACNVHFRHSYFTPSAIGHKALAVNISDLAACGANPYGFVLNLTLTERENAPWLEEFFASMAKLAQEHNMVLCGGDLAKNPVQSHGIPSWEALPPKPSSKGAEPLCKPHNWRFFANKVCRKSPMRGLGGNHFPQKRKKMRGLVGNHFPQKIQTNTNWNAMVQNPTQAFNQINEFSPSTYSSSGLNIGITVFGDYSHGGNPLLRQGYYDALGEKVIASEGDIVFLVGEVGLARLGFLCLESAKNIEDVALFTTKYPRGVNAHLYPKPLVTEGLMLSHMARNFPLYLMDVSDGLMRDVPRLLSRQGILQEDSVRLCASLFITEAMLDVEVHEYCEEQQLDPVTFAYTGGEDYALLGICAKDAWLDMREQWYIKDCLAPLQEIGVIVKGNSLLLNKKTVLESGFDHFKE